MNPGGKKKECHPHRSPFGWYPLLISPGFGILRVLPEKKSINEQEQHRLDYIP